MDPLKTIIWNNKERNVEFIHFKSQYAMPPAKFAHEINEMAESLQAQEMKEDPLRFKINESCDNLFKVRVGTKLCQTNFYQDNPSTSKDEVKATKGGLPIF